MDWDRNGARMDDAAPTSAASAKAAPPRQPRRKNHPCTTGENRTRAGFSTDEHTAGRGNCTSDSELCRPPGYATTSLRTAVVIFIPMGAPQAHLTLRMTTDNLLATARLGCSGSDHNSATLFPRDFSGSAQLSWC